MTHSETDPNGQERWDLELAILLQADGPVVTREAVTNRDLADHQSELWFQGCVRRGYRDVPVDDLDFRIVPIFRKDTGGCTNFLIESTDPDGQPIRLEFTLYSLEHAAERASARLMAAEVLKTGDFYWYRIVPHRVDAPSPRPQPAAGSIGGLKLKERASALTFLNRPLESLLAKATAVGLDDDRNPYPVFYTAAALAKAEALARKGARVSPPVETGALLLGPLATCGRTNEVYAVVTDVLELFDAEQEKYSLTLSGETWRRVQAVVRALQADTPHLRILGQAHGHNFLPNEPGVCSVTGLSDSAFVSKDDRVWGSAVFSGQPYQLCMIYGLDTEGRKVQKLFGLEDGRLLERGYYVIPEFEPAEPSENVVTSVS